MFGKFAGPAEGGDGPGMAIEDGMFLGQGYLSAKGSTLKYKEYSQGQEGNVVAFFKTNGDKSGVYGEYAGFFDTVACPLNNPENPYGEYSPDEVMDCQVNVFAYYQYYMSKADKAFCRRLYQAEKLDFPTEESPNKTNLQEVIIIIDDKIFISKSFK